MASAPSRSAIRPMASRMAAAARMENRTGSPARADVPQSGGNADTPFGRQLRRREDRAKLFYRGIDGAAESVAYPSTGSRQGFCAASRHARPGPDPSAQAHRARLCARTADRQLLIILPRTLSVEEQLVRNSPRASRGRWDHGFGCPFFIGGYQWRPGRQAAQDLPANFASRCWAVMRIRVAPIKSQTSLPRVQGTSASARPNWSILWRAFHVYRPGRS